MGEEGIERSQFWNGAEKMAERLVLFQIVKGNFIYSMCCQEQEELWLDYV